MRTSKYGESDASTLEDPILQAGNPIKEILLKLNLPDHRSVLTEPKEIDDEDIPMAPFKRKKKDQIKIITRTRLCRLFDEDSSDQEKDLDDDSCDQAEDIYEYSRDQEEFYDEDSSNLEEYLGLFNESDQEEDLCEDHSDGGWV
nr:hypothetical protein [Tanacetum cinerariifolium]